MVAIDRRVPERRSHVADVIRHLRDIIRFLAPVFGLLVIWELLVRVGAFDGRVLPPPTLILARALELLSGASDGVLFEHIGKSLYRALLAFALAVGVALPLGFWLGLNRITYSWTSPLISFLLPLPAVAWTPIFLVALGHGNTTIVLVCFLGAVFPVLYSTIQGVQAISRQSIWVVKSMGATRIDIFFKVLVPASLPTLMTG